MSYGLFNCELLEISLGEGNEKLLLIITLFILLYTEKDRTSNVRLKIMVKPSNKKKYIINDEFPSAKFVGMTK